ncbi:uncharacterized protein Dwil_GK14212 [Drosophila willistoni]|uniref:Odorant receptor n=1 Tax=Drosophila willistoni TaxID=7260 RepID=B4NHF1_DROWI|nr:putative odorant receptor 83c [Drosophila willistoni]EDW84627.2 uncharacterized protein Dwil_GK14212 [Drosophila willistoni]
MSKEVDEPLQRFCELSQHINKFTNLLGVDVLAVDLKWNFRTWTTTFAIINYTGFTLLSIILNAHDWKECLKISLMLGGLFHGIGKFFTCLFKQSRMRYITFYTSNIFKEYEQLSPIYVKILNIGLDRLLQIMWILRNGYLVTFLLMTVIPLGLLFYNGTRVTIMQYQIPGLPLENNISYTITYIIQIVTISVAGFGFYAGDLFVLLALTQILTFADILQVKVNKLNESLKGKSAKRAEMAQVGALVEGEYERHTILLEVVKWHQEFTSYCRYVNDLYHDLIASQVLSMAMAVMLSFCINLISFHLPSAIYFVVSAYSMVVYCILGTKIEFAYDQVYTSICDISWQELSSKQRKYFGMVLREAQRPPTITILGVMPLSVRTALQITKLIYSLSMMMMQNRT